MKKNYNAPVTEEMKHLSGTLMDLTLNTSAYGGEFEAPVRMGNRGDYE